MIWIPAFARMTGKSHFPHAKKRGMYEKIRQHIVFKMNNPLIINVNIGQESVRLDVWLARQLTGMSRSRIQQLIRAGFVKINMRKVKESHKIKPGERVEISIPPPREIELKAEKIPLNILFDDDSILVIDKPAGMVVHPAAGHDSGTLVNAVLYHCPRLGGIGGELRPGIVHRLDKDTSGVIVVAKTEVAIASLADQFKRRQIHKEYLAVVRGVFFPASGVIKTLIGRHLTDRKKMTAKPKKGRLAITRYKTAEIFSQYSLMRLFPETGRTHQIRVHLAHLEHPVVGDRQYGRRAAGDLPIEINRQMLHASKISFRHPASGARMDFTAPIPDDMQRLLDYLRGALTRS